MTEHVDFCSCYQVFKVQVHPRFVEIQNLNQYSSELRNASLLEGESLVPTVTDINQRWDRLVNNIAKREVRHFERTLH